MASLRNGSVTESATGGFSYAQAAKGRSPSVSANKAQGSAASGTATPSSLNTSDLTPGSSWADDADINATESVTSKKPEMRRSGSEAATKEGSSSEAPNTSPLPSNITSPDLAVSTSTPNTSHDDSASSHNTSETTWDSKSSSSDPPSKVADSKEDKDLPDGTSENVKEQAPPKPTLQEAKAPTVNIWMQRAEAMKAKAATQGPQSSPSSASTASRGEVTRADARKKKGTMAVTATEHEHVSGASKDWKKNDTAPRAREDFRANHARRESRTDETNSSTPRRTPIKAREQTTSDAAPPSVKSEVAWPKPMDAHDEERKKSLDKDDKSEKERSAAVNAVKHGKTEWKVMPYTPSAVFETTMSGRGGTRMGRGAPRGGGAGASGRGAFQGANGAAEAQKPNPRASSLPNGDSPTAEQVSSAKADREAMPPPPAKATRASSEGYWKEAESPDGTQKPNGLASAQELAPTASKISDAGTTTQNDANSRQPASARRNKSPRKSDIAARRSGASEEVSGRRQSFTGPNEGSSDVASFKEPDTFTPKASFTDRQQSGDTRDNQSFREGNSKRGRRGGGRGMPNGHYPSPHQYNNMNGFSDYPTSPYGVPSQAPFQSPRGGHFPQQGRNGYRNNNVRSQSNPMDAFGRPHFPGYPMMQQMQPVMPDYYGNFPGAPYPYSPTSERDAVQAAVAQQVEYYFSIDNMVKDIFLRKQMDSQGYIFLTVIAEFNRLKQLTTDYDLLKSVCLQSTVIEIRIGDDGKDRLRKVGDWERWVLPMADRDMSAQTDGPASVRRPSTTQLRTFEQPAFYPRSPASAGSQGTFAKADRSFQMMNGGPPPFYPSGVEPGYGDFTNAEETRGRQAKPVQHRESNISPLANGFTMPSDVTNGESSDAFSSSQIDGLIVVVRKHDVAKQRPSHSAGSRTFSNGSIDSRSIMEEMSKPVTQEAKAEVNGEAATNGEADPSQSALTLFWVKDKESPVDIDSLPADTTHELYSHLRVKALAQREAAATGTCPYDLDVLYQFWSHFLIRNFNSHMYSEFRQLAAADSSQRRNDIGLGNLFKFYIESLYSQGPIRDNVAEHYAELVKSEVAKSEATKSECSAFTQLKKAWRDGALNLKNRKKLGDVLDASIKTQLEAFSASQSHDTVSPPH